MPMKTQRKPKKKKEPLKPVGETYIQDYHGKEYWGKLEENADAYRMYLLVSHFVRYEGDDKTEDSGWIDAPEIPAWGRKKDKSYRDRKYRALKFLVDNGILEKDGEGIQVPRVRLGENAPTKERWKHERRYNVFKRYRADELVSDLLSKKYWTDAVLLHTMWRQSREQLLEGKRIAVIARRTAQPLTEKQFRTALNRLYDRGLILRITEEEQSWLEGNIEFWRARQKRDKSATNEYKLGDIGTIVKLCGSGFYDYEVLKSTRSDPKKGPIQTQKGPTLKKGGKQGIEKGLSTRQPDGIHRGCNGSSSGRTQTGIPGQLEYSRTVALQSGDRPPKAASPHREDSFSSSRNPEDPIVSPEDPTEFPDSRSLVSPVNLPDSPGSPVESESVSRLFGVSRFFVDPRVVESWEKLVIRLSRLLPRNLPEDRVLQVLSSVYDHVEQRVLKQKSPDLNVYAYSKDLELTFSRFHGDIPSFTRWVDACTIQGLWKTSDLSPSQLDRVTTLHARTLLLETDPPVLREIERIQRTWDSPEGPEEGTPLYHLWMAGVFGEKELDLQMDPVYRKYPEIYEHQLQELRDEREKHMGLAGDSVKYLEPLAADGYFRKILNLREFLTRTPDEEDEEFSRFYEDHEQLQVKLPEAPVSQEFAVVLCWIARHPESTLDEVIERFDNL